MNPAIKHLTWAFLVSATAACGGCGSSPPQPAPPPSVPSMPVAPLPPQATPCDQAQTLAMSSAMQARAAGEAPGMKPDGPPVCGVVAEGQVYNSPLFTLEPGYCYTFLGQSLPPISQMEMVLQGDASGLVAPFLPTVAPSAQAPLLVTMTPGERVTMGEKQSCYPTQFPVPVKLILKARAGSGPVAAQVYRKKKY